MTLRKYLPYPLLFIFLSSFVYGQDTSKVIGKWTLTKHLLSYDGKEKNMWTSDFKATYIFKPDGTWTWTYWRKGYGTTVTAGKWSLTTNGKKIKLYNNKFLPPHDKDGLVGDHDLNVLKLNNLEFVTNEYLFAEDPVGTSYYNRDK